MKIIKLIGAASGLTALAFAGLALAADGKSKSISTPDGHPIDELWSGYHFASKETQNMQDDEFANPAMAWHDTGEELWTKVDGEAGKSCSTCHKDAATSMKKVGATFPIYDKKSKSLMNVENRVNLCRTENMKAKPWKYDSTQMLGMAIYVKAQSAGTPVKVKVDGPAAPFFEKGKAFYYERRGQLDMSCAHCHEKYYGKQIRMNTLSQGQSNGFPTYRLKWQKPGSLHRRFSGCNKQVRAKPFKKGSPEYLALELYLAWRGQGLTVETPSVRN